MPSSNLPSTGSSTFWERILFPHSGIHKDKLCALLRDKAILLTGASSGIGFELMNLLSQCPVTLIVCSRQKDTLQELVNSLPNVKATIHVYELDLKLQTSVDQLVSGLKAIGIKPFLLIACAGKSIHRMLLPYPERFHDTVRACNVNYKGTTGLVHAFLPEITEAGGIVINISALNVLLPPTAGWAAYQASKAAADQWFRCLAPELEAAGGKVISIYLPLVRTPMSLINFKNDKKPAMSAVQAAHKILKATYSKKAIWKPWWTPVPVILAAIFPQLWHRIQVFKLKK